MCLLMIVDLLMHIYCVDSCGVALFEHGACTTCHVFLVALRAACSVWQCVIGCTCAWCPGGACEVSERGHGCWGAMSPELSW